MLSSAEQYVQQSPPAAAQYALSAALVSPVDAQPTALMAPGRSLRMRFTWRSSSSSSSSSSRNDSTIC
jgi:hypothetical protein